MLGERLGGERPSSSFSCVLVSVRWARAASSAAPARAIASRGISPLGEIGLGEQRQHGGRVAQARAEVGTRLARVALGFERVSAAAKTLPARARSPSIASAAPSCALASGVAKASSLASER